MIKNRLSDLHIKNTLNVNNQLNVLVYSHFRQVFCNIFDMRSVLQYLQ